MRYQKSILDLVNASTDHMTAEQIFFALKALYPAVVMATVYNNLNSLCQQGLIRKVSIEGQPDRYDRTIRHDHLVCSRCGQLTDLFLPDMAADLARQVGFPVRSYDLKIQYLCPKCRELENKANAGA